MWRIGIIEKGKMYYWMLILWSLKNPRRLPIAVRLSIYGVHFRKMLKNIYPQMKEIAANSTNEYGTVDHV
jgi:hypothetical protein